MLCGDNGNGNRGLPNWERATVEFLESSAELSLRMSTAKGQLAELDAELLLWIATMLPSLGDYLRLECVSKDVNIYLLPHRRTAISVLGESYEPHSSPEMDIVRHLLRIPRFVSFEGQPTAVELLRVSDLFSARRTDLYKEVQMHAGVIDTLIRAMHEHERELVDKSRELMYNRVESYAFGFLINTINDRRQELKERHSELCSLMTFHGIRFRTSMRTLGHLNDPNSQSRWRTLTKSILKSPRFSKGGRKG